MIASIEMQENYWYACVLFMIYLQNKSYIQDGLIYYLRLGEDKSYRFPWGHYVLI
jgi:hypothetical protein